MAAAARCSLCGLKAPTRKFITRRRAVVVVLVCPRCDVASPKAKT